MIRRTTNLTVNNAAAVTTPQSLAPANDAATDMPSIGDDLLRGADEIAKFVFGDVKHRRKVYYLTGDAKKGLPYFKMGSLVCARKSTLLNWIAEQEEQQSRRYGS